MVLSDEILKIKRYSVLLIALFLTLGTLYLIRGTFASKEIIVTAGIETEKPLTVQVFYTETANKNFNGPESVTAKVPLGKSNLKMVIPVGHIERFRFDFGWNTGKVILSHLKLSGDKTIYPDFNQFTYNSHIKTHSIEENRLTITSDMTDPYIILNTPLDLSSGHKIDWCRLVILSCFFAFVFSKGISYLWRFKKLENQTVSDIVLLGIFFILLFIPMLNISDAEKSEQENRMLVKKPQLVLANGVINNTYGTKFNDWFSDRFWGRNSLVSLQKGALYLLKKRQMGRVIIGKDNFLFSTHYDFENRIRNNNLFSAEEMDLINSNLNALNDWAKKKNIRIFLEVNPDKDTLYEEYLPPIFKKANPITRREQLLKGLNNFDQITVVSSAEKLTSAKKDGLLFAKSGTHPTDLGAYVIYKNLIENILPYYPSVEAPKTFNEKFDKKVDTDILKNLGISESLYGEKDLYAEANKFDVPAPIKVEARESKRINYKDAISTYRNTALEKSPRVFIISDSFVLRYINYMQNHYSQIVHVFVGDGREFELDKYGDKINELKPDMIIISSCERFLERLKELHQPKE